MNSHVHHMQVGLADDHVRLVLTEYDEDGYVHPIQSAIHYLDANTYALMIKSGVLRIDVTKHFDYADIGRLYFYFPHRDIDVICFSE